MREIQAFLAAMYVVEVSPDLISTVTDGLVAEVTAWQSRPLERVCPVVFFHALRVKIRDEGREFPKESEAKPSWTDNRQGAWTTQRESARTSMRQNDRL